MVEAVRHAQAAGDWTHAAHLLADHIFSLLLNGQDATVGALLTAFPEGALSDPQLDARSSRAINWSAGRSTTRRRTSPSPSGTPPRCPTSGGIASRLLLAVSRLSLACRSGDFGSVFSDVQPLLELDPEAADTLGEVALGNDVRALALMNLGIARCGRGGSTRRSGTWSRASRWRGGSAGRTSRSAVWLTWPWPTARRSFARERERCLEAIAIAEAHGWATEPIVCVALATMGAADVWQGRFAAAQPWLDRAERALSPDLEPTTALLVHLARGILHVGQGPARAGARRLPRRRAVPDEARRAARAGGPGPAVPGVHEAAAGPDGGRPRDAGRG